MRSIGKDQARPPAAPKGLLFRSGSLGAAVMALVFLFALVFAANQNDVIGWLVVIVALGWLLLAIFVVTTVQKATKKATAKLAEAHAQFTGQGRFGAQPPSGGGTRVVSESGGIRDEKLSHSFKIVQVQVGVVEKELAKGEAADRDAVARALETIRITAHNGAGMLGNGGDSPLAGTVID